MAHADRSWKSRRVLFPHLFWRRTTIHCRSLEGLSAVFMLRSGGVAFFPPKPKQNIPAPVPNSRGPGAPRHIHGKGLKTSPTL